jgi:MFS family permease
MTRRLTYKTWVLVLLTVILAFNNMDRLVLGIVMQYIKIDLQLTDTQLGFLSGLAFAAFYAVMGIPIARWADRGNRVTIITLTTALWSVGVALCGAVANFTQLLLVRVGVAVGEAGCVPPAHSLIADYFDRFERPRAVSLYMQGIPLSLAIGYFAAGWLNELYGWRTTFVLTGVPGLGLALLTWLCVREPRSRISLEPLKSDPQSGGSSPFNDVCAQLWRNRAFRHLLICFSIWYFFGYGLLQWTPAFFIRSHGLQTGSLGMWLALIYGIGGSLGTYVGGEWAARYAAGNERLQLKASALAFVVYGGFHVCAFLATNRYVAFAELALANFGGQISQGPMLATMQTLVPGRMRAMSIALVYLFANLIGMGLGPWTAGALSDSLRPWVGEESLRYALVILSPGYFWAAWHIWLAGRTVMQDLKAAEAAGGRPDFSRLGRQTEVPAQVHQGRG